jgi:hypothetical protein
MGDLIDARHLFSGDTLMTKKQLADYLQRSTRWVELMSREGLPSYKRNNGHMRYSRREVDAWLDERGSRA